jgi:hypothetical protein
MQQVVLIRVGVDTGAGGIHGPLFADGSFEYIPIPDRFGSTNGVDARTYGTVLGGKHEPLINYFPTRRRSKYKDQPIHFDPEFESFTYGDPSTLKSRLKTLQENDLLVFYAGLQGWDFHRDPALYIIGFFSVSCAGLPKQLTERFGSTKWREYFAKNFHVRHSVVFKDQKDRLVLVKGDQAKSRLLTRAVQISAVGKDRTGRDIHVLSPDMQKIFGHFDGHTSIHRSPPRWVLPTFTDKAAEFVSALR